MLNQTLLTLVAALGRNRVIGKDNDLLWHLPNDFAFFKQQTLGKPILMGRKTWDSLPIKPLPKRLNLILSSNKNLKLPEGAISVGSLDEATQHAPNAELMIIGGSMIYELTLPYADKLILTYVDADIEGDAYFPEFNDNDWQTTWQATHVSDDRHVYGYTFKIHQRVNQNRHVKVPAGL